MPLTLDPPILAAMNGDQSPLLKLRPETLDARLTANPRLAKVEALCGRLPPAELQAQFTRLSAGATFRRALTDLEVSPDVAQARARYGVVGFCYDGSGAKGPGLTTVCGEAVMPHAWARASWNGLFSQVDYVEPNPAGPLDQATLVLAK